MKRPIRSVAVWIAASLLLGGCSPLSVQQEKKLGLQVQREVRAQKVFMRDAIVVDYVRSIGQKMARSSRPSPFDFRFYVIEDEGINAFAIPGGAVYVHTGLITSASNVAEVAGVLAHEIGHVTARHVAHLYNRQRNTGVIAQVVAMVFGILSGNAYIARGGELATQVAANSYLNTFTQDAEREADRLAVETMIQAGYDPEALVTMLQTLQSESAGGLAMPQFLRSHPATAERIQNVLALIQAQKPNQQMLLVDRKLKIIQRRIELIAGTDREKERDLE